MTEQEETVLCRRRPHSVPTTYLNRPLPVNPPFLSSPLEICPPVPEKNVKNKNPVAVADCVLKQQEDHNFPPKLDLDKLGIMQPVNAVLFPVITSGWREMHLYSQARDYGEKINPISVSKLLISTSKQLSGMF